MAKIGKYLLLFVILALVVSSQIIIIPTIAQSIPKPSIPEFSLNVANQNDGAPTNIEITIRNQPFSSSIDTSGNNTNLYYNVGFKGHYADVWNYYPANRTSSYIVASTTDYTTITFALGSSPLGAVPAGGQVDFQVQALIGHDIKISSNLYEFAGETSYWSSTQTLTMPEASSNSPTPTTSPLTSTQVSISVDTSSATVGASVNISGKLNDSNGNPLSSKAVTLSYTLVGSSNIVPIGSDTTNTDGEYAIQWVNTASGTFTLTVEWSGDSVYQPSRNSITLNFLPYQNHNIFLVESNSTVTGFAYNSTNSELSFTVTGASDTTGYVKMTLSKSLTSNPENIKVYLDGNQLNYLVTSNADSWQLTFNYHHSAHFITIALQSASSTLFFQTQLGELVIIGVAIVISIAVVLIALRKRKKNLGRTNDSLNKE
ncbi:MAG: hypothetical protein NWE93_05305 [Candidatus Bathyarchaeota archaeon]|nr:hypothetical protein [Candidatus Bathyarchaeota archaeon]